MSKSRNFFHWPNLLETQQSENMPRIAEAFGSFGTYADEATSEGLGEDLPQRFDVSRYYITSGVEGSGNSDDADTAASRTNYFRETYAYGDEILAPGIEGFMNLARLEEASRVLSSSQRVKPVIVYANLLLPGQELALHTDVPEFRGLNRKNVPQWLLVCMLHSGLFAQWRIPILTCVSWWGSADGGAFTFYPDGPDGVRDSIPATDNSAILIDTDRIYHGVERVGDYQSDLPEIGKDTRLHFVGGQDWALRDNERTLANYQWADIRYSISWKAYCFSDDSDYARWQQGSDDLTLPAVLDRLESALRECGALEGPRPAPTEFAMLLVNTFVKFPGDAVAA
jgi:hypothetical protein